jgi:hypothetical protein
MSAARSRVVLRGLPREVAGVLRRQFLAALAPAAVLGAAAGLIEILRHYIAAEIALGLTLAIIFELYVGYAELIVAADRAPGPRPPVRHLLRRALPSTPALLLASAVAVSVPLAASGALVLPGLWLMTVWALFAPAIVHEHLGIAASLRRSRELVRGAFWAVAATVTVSVLIEHAAIHAAAHTAEPTLGHPLLGLAGAALVTLIVSPPAAFTISVVYERLERAAPEHPVQPTTARRVPAAR